MKLNPPETAPMDTVIWADFGGAVMLPAAWNPATTAWSVAATYAYRSGDNPWDVYFDTVTYSAASLRGWLPMPHKSTKKET